VPSDSRDSSGANRGKTAGRREGSGYRAIAGRFPAVVEGRQRGDAWRIPAEGRLPPDQGFRSSPRSGTVGVHPRSPRMPLARTPRRSRVAALAGTLASTLAAFPSLAGGGWTIVDLGLVDPGDFAAQGTGMSPEGIAVGRSAGTSNQAFAWTEGSGLLGLPNLATHPFGVANDAAMIGGEMVVVGTGSVTFFGSDPRPLVWRDGAVEILPLPAGETLGRANAVNASGLAVGSVDGGSLEQAAVFQVGGAGSIITAVAPDGSTMRTCFGVNDAGLVVGIGGDPNNAARNVGSVYDRVAGTLAEVGALPGANGAICFGVSNGGHVVGSSMQNQGSGLPFIWTEADGIRPIPLPVGTSQGSARAVNASGEAVGIASNAFAIPFWFDGVSTHRLQDLLPPDTPWDLSTNTSSGALGISDAGVIVGTGELGGEIRAFAMFPPPADCLGDLDGSGDVGFNDLLSVLAAFGACPGGGEPCPADLDGDGDADFGDLLILLAAWGPCP